MHQRATYPDIRGKVFIVTGAASGMGRTLSLQLASQGAHIGLVDLRKPDAVAEEISKLGGQCIAVACNVQDAEAVDSSFKAVVHHFNGQLDGAANMAGIVGDQKLGEKKYALDALDDRDWDKILLTNLNGVKNCLRAEFRLMKGPGSIINAASISGQHGHPYASPYNTSKWGVIGLTKCAAQEGGPRAIRVNAVAPGIIKTPLTASLGPPEVLDQYLGSHIALGGRLAQPEEITKVIVFLLSEEASYMTGSVVNIDGGWE